MMNDRWKEFLIAADALFEPDGTVRFDTVDVEARAAAGGTIVAPLTHLSLIRVTGTDALSFLQNQLSNDVAQMDAGHTRLAAYCDPKGRMLALFRVFQRDGDLFLQVPAALVADTLVRLRQFVMRAKVTLAHADTELIQLGLAGPDAAERLETAIGVTLTATETVATTADTTVLRLPGIEPRFALIAPITTAGPLWRTLCANTSRAGTHAWNWLEIVAGIPTILPATRAEFVPQMANLDLIGGISFTKGCYPGQEIVARLHYLGRLKQRMVLAHIDIGPCPQPGDPVYTPDLPGQATGRIINAAPAPGDGFDLLVVVHIASVNAGTLHLGTTNGPRLMLRPLPYASIFN